jgi:hypothetical protein
VFQFVSMCCSVFAHGLIVNRFVAVRCSAFSECVAVCSVGPWFSLFHCVAVCLYTASQSINLLEFVAACCNALECVAVCFNVLQCACTQPHLPVAVRDKGPFHNVLVVHLDEGHLAHLCVCVAVCCSVL